MASPPAFVNSSNPPPFDSIPCTNLEYHIFQMQEEHDRNLSHYNKMFSPSCKLAMNSKYQNADILSAFSNIDNFTKEKDLQIEICKHTRQIQPRNNARYHAADDLINAYAKIRCNVD